MIDLYYVLRDYIKNENYTYSFNDYDENLENSIGLIFRDGLNQYRDLSTGLSINECLRVQIVGIAGKTKNSIVSMNSYLQEVKEKLEILNNKTLLSDDGEHQVFVISTEVSNINYLGKNKQEVATYSLNGMIIYK